MKNLMRNLTLSAAALAALVAIAPAASADGGSRDRSGQTHGSNGLNGQNNGQSNHGGQSHGGQSYGGQSYGHGHTVYAAPARSYYAPRYVAPYRVYAGSHFYSYRPGPGYFYINALGWVFPPFPGAVWVPAHYDIGGFWVEGCWR